VPTLIFEHELRRLLCHDLPTGAGFIIRVCV